MFRVVHVNGNTNNVYKKIGRTQKRRERECQTFSCDIQPSRAKAGATGVFVWSF
eukprot:m.37681 g.37681  ORF g.37681 m.37681 type:complete len:54 (-) comp11410_c1_seq1:1584-1745(-)